jgi:uncharacterized protein with NAD-binding domain and iron-sulfur cluster
MTSRTRVAVLGGGIAGLTTAWYLSSTPELRARFAVTVYQAGWRLGGKLASSRDRRGGHRSLEHGLHVWFGFYENAFGLMRQVLAAWQPPQDSPIRGFEDAFIPHDFTPIGGRDEQGRAFAWPVTWPRNEDEPGRGRIELSGWGALSHVLSLCRGVLGRELDKPGRTWTPRAGALQAWDKLAAALPARLDDARGIQRFRKLLKLADRALERRAARLTPQTVDRHPVLCLVDLVLALLDGLTDPRYRICEDQDLDVLNHLELREFLKRHGGDPDIVDHWSGLRMIYDSTFQYRGSTPDFAAGAAIRVVLRTTTQYKGSVLYHVAAGMGEVVISPLFETLKQHGVRFCFFEELTDVAARAGRVTRLDLRQQVPGARAYQPTFLHRGLVCWPEEPLWEQLEERVEGDLERQWDRPEGRAHSLVRGRDFDEVVLAIPPGVVRERGIGRALSRHAPFEAMLRATELVPTAALQLWHDATLPELGWTDPSPALVGWTWPLSIWAEMPQVLATEDHTGGSLHYLCGNWDSELWRSETSPLAEAQQALEREVELQLERDPLWPARSPPRDRYLRANIDPAECAVASPARGVQARLAAHESGLSNLTLAGAWTRNGLDAECVEAAVMSGMQAARWLRGDDLEVVGEDFLGRAPRPD